MMLGSLLRFYHFTRLILAFQNLIKSVHTTSLNLFVVLSELISSPSFANEHILPRDVEMFIEVSDECASGQT